MGTLWSQLDVNNVIDRFFKTNHMANTQGREIAKVCQRKISIIIPSLRIDKLNNCIQAIVDNTYDLDYEIIVVSPQSVIQGCRQQVKWVEDAESRGVIPAIKRGLQISEGEFICVLSDECLVQSHCLDNAVMAASAQEENVVVTLHAVPETRFEYYGRIFAPFPVIRRSLIEKLGCFYDENYKAFYADPDLSLRVYAMGGNIMVCPTAVVYSPYINDHIHASNVSNYLEQDRAFFINRWQHLGEFRDP